jgi:hypothetical protein
LRESWPFCHIEKKGLFFSTDFGLRFFYTNSSQILESRFWNRSQIFALIFFLHGCSQIRIFTHLWNIYTGVEVTQHNDTIVTIEGSSATSPPVAASLAKGALMASLAVAPLAVSVLLPAVVAWTKKRQLRREDDEDDLCEKDWQLACPRREETPVDHPLERDRPLVAFGGTFVDSAQSIDVALTSRGRHRYCRLFRCQLPQREEK